MPSVAAALERNLEAVDKPEFVEDILAELRLNRVKILRLHVSGDFLSPDYAEKWFNIVERSRRVTVFAYTRSWITDSIRPWLIRLGGIPNFHMWWSTDRDTHAAANYPPSQVGRVAYMAKTPDERIPEYADLVFRVYRNTVEKYKDGRLVCPAEQGVKPTRGPKMTCEACKLCHTKSNIRRK